MYVRMYVCMYIYSYQYMYDCHIQGYMRHLHKSLREEHYLHHLVIYNMVYLTSH